MSTAMSADLIHYDLRLESDADYLNLLTRKVFHSGFNKALVDRKWPAFEELFGGFDPAFVATMSEADQLLLATDTRIVRHRGKIAATIWNARQFRAISKAHGSWRDWLFSFRDKPYELCAAALTATLQRCGPNTAFYFLLEAGEATPDDKPEDVK